MTSTDITPLRFVTCVRDGLDLVCTPWDYARHGGTVRGEPVRLSGVLTSTQRRFYPHSKLEEFIGWVDYTDTLRRVCELAGHGPSGYTLLSGISGRSWTLELSSGTRLWCVA